MSDVPDDMVPDHNRAAGFSLVVGADETPTCPECTVEMTVKPLQLDGLESDAKADAYRCPQCGEFFVEFPDSLPLDDFHRNFSFEDLEKAINRKDPREGWGE